MSTSIVNVKFTIKSVQTEDLKKLEQEVWRLRRMIDLMLDTASDEAISVFGGVITSLERVE